MLMEYDFKVVHRVGLVNMDADGLSRNPIPNQADATGARQGCHKGRFWRKITVRMSFSSGRPRASAFTL
jgi:hypothetical protein